MSRRRSLIIGVGVVDISYSIMYTSSDGNVVNPYNTSAFGVANIVSNTYVDGKGVIEFDDDVTVIGDLAFFGCNSLTSVTIPDSATSIGYKAFRDCISLTSITIPDSVTSIEGNVFYNCRSLTSVTIGNNITTIEEGTFSGCTLLTDITIPDSVTTIGNYAFAYCESLTSVTIPDSVTSIGQYAFYGCTSITSVTIGNSVTTIEDNTFYNCTSLTSITIPDSVTEIGNAAFSNCRSLTSVYCKPTTPPTGGGSYMFAENASGRKIYVPYQSLDAYKTAEYWSDYASDIVGYDFENDTVVGGGNNLITFTVNGDEYQAEEGMTFYDWAMSEYYDDSCPLFLILSFKYDLRNGIIQENISPGDAIGIVYGAGLPLIPGINTDTIIQPISYMPDMGGIDEVG